MANVHCLSCNKTKKEEHFAVESLNSQHPSCSTCDVKMLMRRVTGAKREVLSMKKQQEFVKDIADKVEKKEPVRKQSSASFLKSILNSAQ